jgi:predicted XRE-type DNA-binding protein
MSTWFRETPESARALAEETALLDAAELVSKAIVKRGATRMALSKRLGVPRSEISQRLGGKRNLTVRTLAAMLHELDFELQLRVRDRSGARPVWRSSTEIGTDTRYTGTGQAVRLVRADAA